MRHIWKRILRNPLNQLYDQYGLSKGLRRDLNLFIIAVTSGQFFFNVVFGPPLTGYARALGADDFYYGLLTGIPLAACAFQLAASWWLGRYRNRRKVFIITGLIQRSLWLLVAAVPLIVPMETGLYRLWAMLTFLTLSAIAKAFVDVSFMSWFGAVIPDAMKGRYISIRSAIAIGVGIAASFLFSWALDVLPGMSGYMIVFGIAALCGIGDIVIAGLAKDDFPQPPVETESYLKTLKTALWNKPFVKYLLFWTLWNFCLYLTASYYNMFALGSMELSFTTFNWLNVAGTGAAIISLGWWGHKLDERGHSWVLYRMGAIACLAPVALIFARQGVIWPLLVNAILSGLSYNAIDMTATQMLVTVTPIRNRETYIALYYVVTSMLGATLGNILGGVILDYMGDIILRLGGLILNRYQLLFIGVTILRYCLLVALMPGLKHLKAQQE